MPDQVASYIGDRFSELSEFLWGRLNGGEFGDKDYARVLFKLEALCVRGDKLVTELKELSQSRREGTEQAKE